MGFSIVRKLTGSLECHKKIRHSGHICKSLSLYKVLEASSCQHCGTYLQFLKPRDFIEHELIPPTGPIRNVIYVARTQ